MAERDPTIDRPRIVIDGELAERALQLVESGDYESLDDVAKAAFEAFEREERAWNAHVAKLVQESVDDPRPGAPIDEVFDRLRKRVEARHQA